MYWQGGVAGAGCSRVTPKFPKWFRSVCSVASVADRWSVLNSAGAGCFRWRRWCWVLPGDAQISRMVSIGVGGVGGRWRRWAVQVARRWCWVLPGDAQISSRLCSVASVADRLGGVGCAGWRRLLIGARWHRLLIGGRCSIRLVLGASAGVAGAGCSRVTPKFPKWVLGGVLPGDAQISQMVSIGVLGGIGC